MREPPAKAGFVTGFGPERRPVGATAGHAETDPGDRGSPHGGPWFGEAGGSISVDAGLARRVYPGPMPRPSARKATAGHSRPWPSGGSRPPPCAGEAGRSDERPFRGSQGGRMFPGPSGSHQVLRGLGGGPPGSEEFLGFDGRSFGTVPENMRTSGEILGFPRKHRVPPAGALQPRRLGRRSVRDRCGEACLRADGPSATGEVRGSPGGADRWVAASGRFASRGRRPRHRRGSCRGRGRAEDAKKTPPPSCAGALTGSMRRRGPCPPGHCRESNLSNPAPHFLWARAPIVNQVLWLACENHYM